MNKQINNRPKYKQEIINQIINFFWTFLCFAPVLWFWIKEGMNMYFYSFLSISLLVGILPNSILDLLMFGSSKKFYEKLGVKYIVKFVQNGSVVKNLTNKQGYVIINGKSQARQYLKTISMYERFHWICLLFFTLTTTYCLFHGYFRTGGVITVSNIFYNLCPILLQQYNKIRIRKIC